MLIRVQYFMNGFVKGCLPLFPLYFLGFGIELNAIFTMMAVIMALYSLACPIMSVISDATNKIKRYAIGGYTIVAAVYGTVHFLDPKTQFPLISVLLVISFVAYAGCLGLSDKYSNLVCLKRGGDYGKIYIFDPMGILTSQIILLCIGQQYLMSLLFVVGLGLMVISLLQNYDAILADIEKVAVREFFKGLKVVVGNREYLTTLLIACLTVGTSIVVLQNYLVAYFDEVIVPLNPWLTGITILAVCTLLEVVGAGISEKLKSKRGFLLGAFGTLFTVSSLLVLFGQSTSTIVVVGHFLAIGIGVPFTVSYMSRIVDPKYVGTAISLFIAIAIGLASSLILISVSSASPLLTVAENLQESLKGLLVFAIAGVSVAGLYNIRKSHTARAVLD